MSWSPLEAFDDARVPKLAHLRRAAQAGVHVPPTSWVRARDVAAVEGDPGPWADRARVVRSGASDEDLEGGSNAGRYESLFLAPGEALFPAARRVAAGLPADDASVVFVQPAVEGARAGVAFYDGFHWERTTATGDNRALTAGESRGEVERGDTLVPTPWTTWLADVRRALSVALPPTAAIDVEFALDDAGTPTLLQARAAAFEVRRNPLLSLANHREILGDPPSPWLVSALEAAGRRATRFWVDVDPGLAAWRPAYAVRAAGRAWIDLSFFLRLMDRWGLPRRMVTDGIGGATPAAAEGGALQPLRLLRCAPRLVRLQRRSFALARRRNREIARFGADVEAARSLADLFEATVAGLEMALRVNFAINGLLSGLARVRRALRIRGNAEVATTRMWREYEELRDAPPGARAAGLDRWLERWGHRGPLESDPLHPRFREQREMLAADLARSGPAAPRGPAGKPARPRWLFAPDRWREDFRDEHVRVFGRLRERLLEAGARLVARGALARPDDVFFLSAEDVALAEHELAKRARRGRAEHAAAPPVPDLARLDELASARFAANARSEGSLDGVGLGGVATGTVRRASDLARLLAELDAKPLGPDTVLVVPALEPAWGVVFGRVVAVVARLGGELSHGAILLRELGVPAVLDCAGAQHLEEGARVRVDGRAGRVEVLGAPDAA